MFGLDFDRRDLRVFCIWFCVAFLVWLVIDALDALDDQADRLDAIDEYLAELPALVVAIPRAEAPAPAPAEE